MQLASQVFIAAVAFGIGGYFTLSGGIQVVLYNAIALSAATVMIVTALRRRPDALNAWLLIGLGVGASGIGDVVFGESQPVPSLADMFYISAYPLMGLGMSGLASWRPGPRRANVLLAAAIATLVAVLSWAFLILPGHGDALSAQIVAIGYPAMDLILIGLLLRAIRRGEHHLSPLVFLAIALLLMFAADTGYAVADFGSDYSLGDGLDVAWLASYAFFGGALLEVRPRDERIDVDPRQAPDDDDRWLLEDDDDLEVDPLLLPYGGRSPKRIRSHDLRFGVIASWSGRMLLGLGALAAGLGALWLAPDVAILGGAYVFTGLVTWAAAGQGSRA